MRNKTALILLFTANGISGFAQGISMLAIPWYFARQNQSPTFNLIYAFATFLTLFWGIYAGTIVDRFARKKVFLGTNIVEALVILSISAYGWQAGTLPVPLIIAVFTITILGYQIHYPNLYAFAQEITSPKNYSKITSYIEIVGQSTSVASGALAAILLSGWQVDEVLRIFNFSFHIQFTITPWQLYEIFAMDGATYVISVVLISFIRYTPYQQIEVEVGSLRKRIISGFAYLRENPLILLFGLLSYTVFIVVIVQLHALMPMYINNHLAEGAAVLGLSEVLFAAGALTAGFIIRKMFAGWPIPQTVILLMVTISVSYYAASLNSYTRFFYIFCVVIGFANAGTRILRVSYLFSRVPNYLIGRVNSIFGMSNILLRTLFILLFSRAFFNEASNVTYAYLILAGFVFVSACILLSKLRSLTGGKYRIFEEAK